MSEIAHISGKPEFTYHDDVAALLRAYVVSAQRYVDDYAGHHAMHPTDMQAMAVLHQAQQEGIVLNAGALGRALSLSSPATSALLDRLESRGYLTRSADPSDRRRVRLTLAREPLNDIVGFLQPLGTSVAESLADYTDAEVSTIVGFLSRVVRSTSELVRTDHADAGLAPDRSIA